MRTEQEMYSLILNFAKSDERIRLVGMEGSRTNINIPRDSFQDYDISFLVTDMESFKQDDQWLNIFGERIIMQKPEDMELFPPELGNWFSYLMLFKDGIKIDLTLIPLEELDLYLSSDKLLKILLDKDGRVPNPPIPTDEDYWMKKPSPRAFDDCCNEFWFVSTYVAKGLCRNEILFAAQHFEEILRPNLLRMIGWTVGMETRYSCSMGKAYKFLKEFISPALWEELLTTYRKDSYEQMWKSLWTAIHLFRQTSHLMAKGLGCPYPEYDQNVSRYLKQMETSFQQRIFRDELLPNINFLP